MLTLVIFIAVLAVLVLSHEWGHFIVARKNGMGIEEFGFGFPPRIFGIRHLKNEKRWQFIWRNNDDYHGPQTLYSFNLLPLGGFVKIKGEDNQTGANDPDSFAAKKAWQKTAVLVAGVGMNVIVAWLLLSISLMVGLPAEAGLGMPIKNATLEVVEVLPGKPAEAAGVEPGDTIIKVDNLANPSVDAFQAYINDHRSTPVTIDFERGHQEIIKKIQPIIYADTGKGGVGVAIADVGVVRYPWYQALYKGIQETYSDTGLILQGFWQLITAVFAGHATQVDVSGPVGVAVLTGEAARLGVTYFLQFVALLSLNLAILNILPIPALDGGRLLFVIINRFSKKKVAAHTEQIIHTAAFVLLMVLVLVVTIKDITTFQSNILGFFKRII